MVTLVTKYTRDLSSSWPWPRPTWSLTWLSWSLTWPNLALAHLVTKLTKPSLDLGKVWARSRHYNQTTPPPPAPPLNFSKVETWNSYSLTVQNLKGENWIDTIIKQDTPLPPSGRMGGGWGVKKTTFAKKASNDLKCILDHSFHFLANPPPPWQHEWGKGVGKKNIC